MLFKIRDLRNFIHAIINGQHGGDIFGDLVEKKGVAKVYENVVLNVIIPDDIFDHVFNDELKKLSVQEFSRKIKKIPETLPKVRGFKSVLIKNKDFLRKKNEFI